MSLVLVVLLWPHRGADDALVRYEDRVLAWVPDHGGRVIQRARSPRGIGAEGQPLEIQILEFPSADALERFTADPRRQSLAEDREAAVARTDIIEVELIRPD